LISGPLVVVKVWTTVIVLGRESIADRWCRESLKCKTEVDGMKVIKSGPGR
jgi:hypothetical protein